MIRLLALVLLMLLPACAGTASLVGLESVASSNERQEALSDYADQVAEKQAFAKQKETEEAIVAAFAPVEAYAPGTQAFVRDVFARKGVVVVPPTPRPEPKPDESGAISPYIPAAGALLLAVAEAWRQSRKTKVEVNRERDEKRRMRGEALTPEEAAKKGYFEEGKAAA